MMQGKRGLNGFISERFCARCGELRGVGSLCCSGVTPKSKNGISECLWCGDELAYPRSFCHYGCRDEYFLDIAKSNRR